MPIRLVVGLGNPDRKYAATRHNLGYRVCDGLAERMGTAFEREKFSSQMAEGALGGEKVVLLKPLTYMNLSGQAVSKAVGFYQLDLAELLVVCDDFNLVLGRLRLRPDGSHGGHNGLRDVIARLGTDAFPRLRMGIGPLGRQDPVAFCLRPFDEGETPVVEAMIRAATDAVSVWLEQGIDEAMNRFNVRGTTEGPDGPSAPRQVEDRT